jgi:hypothetical protein
MIDPNAYTQVQGDLAAFETTLGAGLIYLRGGEYNSAVDAYKAAGNAGATIIGPEIDGLGAPTVSQPYTQAAWTLNGQLAAINSTSSTGIAATAVDANSAATIAGNMDGQYKAALGAALAGLGVSPNVYGTSTAASASSGVGTAVLVGLGIAIVGGAVWGLSRR